MPAKIESNIELNPIMIGQAKDTMLMIISEKTTTTNPIKKFFKVSIPPSLIDNDLNSEALFNLTG